MQNSDQIFEKAKNLHLKGRIKEAQNLYLKLIQKYKENDKLYFLLGTTFLQIEKYNQAINYLNISIKLNSQFADSYNNLGIALAETNNFSDAIKNYDKAIKLKGKFEDAHLNKGIALNYLKKHDQALSCINEVIKLNKNNAKAFNTLGNIYKDKEKYDDAFSSYKEAIKIEPNYIQALNNVADLLYSFKNYQEALVYLNNIYKLNPNLNGLLNKIFSNKIHIADWGNYNDLTNKIKKDIINRISIADPLFILYISDDPKIIKTNSEEYIKKNKDNFIKKDTSDINFCKRNNKKIKIGYFSAEFHDHPVLHQMAEIFKNHDKDKFEIFAFSHGRLKGDNWRDKIKQYFEQFYIINELSDDKAVQLSRNLGIDIAINLTGLTKNLRTGIFIQKAAPIQINYLGYPATLGTKSIDFIIADKTVIPEKDRKFFTEKVEYLPNYYSPKPKDIFIKKSKKKYTRKYFNLPENEIVFCAITNPIKINPEIFDLWINILKKVPGSVLWLTSRNEKFKENIFKEAIKRGLNKNRLIFTEIIKEKEDHLERLKLADIFLDTFPYNSHSTTYDYIDVNLPLISLSGNSFASRVSASIYSQLGMNELIVKSKNEYENLAINLASNKDLLNKIKDKFKDKKNIEKIFNSEKLTKDLENIYLKLYKGN